MWFSCRHCGRRAKGSTINWIPPEQLEWLRSTIDGSPYPCTVLSHQSFERGHGGPVMNSREVRAIFNEANAKKPGTVRLVANGHHHTDHMRILDGILYWDVNSARFKAWIWRLRFKCDVTGGGGGLHIPRKITKDVV